MNDSRQNTLIRLAAITVSVFFLGACSNEEASQPSEQTQSDTTKSNAQKVQTVRIGHVAPMTGGQAHLGKDNENGARLAIADLNARNISINGQQIRFELLTEDDQADPKQGTIVAQKLVDAKVHGVVGHLNSGTTIPASKIYFDANIPQVSGSATAVKYTRQGFRTAFRVMANDAQQGKALGTFATQQGFKTVAIIDDQSAYGQGLAEEFRKTTENNGIQTVAIEHTNDKAKDFRAILTKVKSKTPDVIFFAGMDPQSGPMVRQMKALGITAKFLTGDGGCTPEFIKHAGSSAGGQFCSLPGLPLEKMPKGNEFKARFKEQYNAEIQLYAPYVYDATMLIADAMQRANSTDPAQYLTVLPKTSYDGVSAQVQFDENGDLKNGSISLYEVKDGQWVYVETIKP